VTLMTEMGIKKTIFDESGGKQVVGDLLENKIPQGL